MRVPGLRIVFSDVLSQLLALLVAAFPLTARAGECGMQTPAYEAERIVTVGDSTQRMRIYVAGALVREETDTLEGVRVTIRDTHRGRTVVVDPHTGRSMVLLLPPRPPQSIDTRTLDEVGPSGTHVYVVQFRRGSAWLDLSRTSCRPDGIMTRQTFISLDPQGHEVEGTLTQDRIRVGLLSPGLFDLLDKAEPNRR